MKEFIEFLVKSVVRNADAVSVIESGEETNFKYSITVDPQDMGLIIGKEGRTINSIRSLAKSKAVKEGTWVEVEITNQDRTTENTGTGNA